MNTTVQVLFAAAVAIAAADAAARDRPGTPNGEKAYACGDQFNQPPAVCVDVNNTASEPVRIEVDVTLNGARMERGAVGGDVQCPERELHLTDEELRRLPFTRTPGGGYIVTTRQVPYRSCEAARMLLEPSHKINVKTGKEVLPNDAIVRHKTGDFDPESRIGVPPQGIRLSNVAPLSKYCFRFRTRRISDEVVSEHWSNWTCAQARALPAKPDAPRFSMSFLPAAWNGSSKDKPLTHRVVLRWQGSARAGFYEVLDHRFPGGKSSYEETIEVPASVIALGGESVELCARNVSGSRCTTALFARVNETDDWMKKQIKGAPEVIRAVEEAAQPKLKPATESNNALPPGSNDFNGDRNGDIVWHNDATHETQIWFMRGHARIGRATVTDAAGGPARIGPPWRIAASNDFNGDGKADLLWYNASTGESQLWFMDGARLASRATVLDEAGQPFLVGLPWHIVAARDMNRDGRADIVWHNRQTGTVQVWMMDREGYRVSQRLGLVAEGTALLTLATPPIAIHDLDNDGSPDLVVRNGTTVQIIFMQGVKVARRSVVHASDRSVVQLGQSWSITGANDFNRDGYGDLLLHDDASGETRQWSMQGDTVVQVRTIDAQLDGGGALVGLPWRQMNQ